MKYFDILPEEITLDILSRLPAEDVLECKLVCTTWRSLVRRPSFSKMHLRRLNHHEDSGKLSFIAMTYINPVIASSSSEKFQYFEYNDENHESIQRITRLNFNLPLEWDTKFLGSCNGLVCYLRENTYTICNPLTREYLILPEIKRVKEGHGASGFGYVDSTNEFKVVRIIFENENKSDIEIYIYTLGSGNGWRNTGKFNFGTREHWGIGTFLKGVLYWVDYELRMILSFHLAEEKLGKHVSPPPLSDSVFDYYYQLGVLGGCLTLAINDRLYGSECWDVRLLKKKDDNHGMKEREGGESLGWSEVSRVYDRLYSNLVAVTKSYGVLTYSSINKHIEIHHPEAPTTSETIVVFEDNIGAVFPHKNTLVSLKELGEEDTKMMD